MSFFPGSQVFSVADLLGRRRELMLASVLYVIGCVLEGISGLFEGAGGLGVMLLGRWVYGVGCGFAMHGVRRVMRMMMMMVMVAVTFLRFDRLCQLLW
jgi:formate hydrogenlyase subunit 3/multisubunit Na+/H+ antiporter MnhD subunit